MMHFTDLTTMSRSLHALYRSLFLGGIGNSAIRALPILLMCVKFSYRGTHYALPQWIPGTRTDRYTDRCGRGAGLVVSLGAHSHDESHIRESAHCGRYPLVGGYYSSMLHWHVLR